MKKIIATILCFVLVFSFVADVYALGSFPSTTDLATALNTFVPSMLTYIPNASGNASTTYTWSGLNQNTYCAGYMGINAGSQGTGIIAYIRGKYAAG